MDGDYPNGMNTLYQGGAQRHPYNALPNFQSQFQDPPQHGSHTLPPIQPQRPVHNHASNSYDGVTRRQQAYPSTGMNFPVYTTHGMSQPIYSHAGSQFSGTSGVFSQPTYSSSMNHDYSQSPANSHGLPHIRPMPLAGSAQMHGLGPAMNTAQSFGMHGGPSPEHDIQSRTHVVGSQGRRGILPSDEGRPMAVGGPGAPTAKTAAIPVKDADGKFPCPHCNKNYLHAKHLKRHLLRRKV